MTAPKPPQGISAPPPAERSSALGRRTVLNLGCGTKHRADAVNLDVTSDTNPDVVHDLNVRPWPFESDSFEQVFAHDVIEHLDDVVRTFEEVHRVCRPGAVVTITVPHFSSPNAFTDPTHRHYFGYFSCSYFTGEHQFSFYTRARFRTRRSQLVFHPSPLNKIVWRLASRWPAQYERRWAWIFPAWFLFFELEVLKPAPPAAVSAAG